MNDFRASLAKAYCAGYHEADGSLGHPDHDRRMIPCFRGYAEADRMIATGFLDITPIPRKPAYVDRPVTTS